MDQIVTEKELCERLKITRLTAYRWRQDGMPYIKVIKAIRYDLTKVQEWLEKKSQENN